MNTFADDLAFSNDDRWVPLWEQIYRRGFVTFERMEAVTNLRHQHRGIDRLVYLAGGKVLTVDEKLRRKVYPDILLEIWSDTRRRRKGWALKDLYCDYLGYAFPSIGRGYLFPFQQLRLALHTHGRQWITEFKYKDAQNKGYVTRSIPVPVSVLMDAVRDACAIEFSPWKPVNEQYKYLCRSCNDPVSEVDLFGDCRFCSPLSGA